MNREHCDVSDHGTDMSRREALKVMGAGLLSAVAVPSLLSSCAGSGRTSDDIPEAVPVTEENLGGIAYRTENTYGKKISLLGFGCMRFPTKDRKIDRELSFELIDYAYRHGVNYYDTAYIYHDGESESFMGEALSRYPRDTYYVATKMPTWNLNGDLDPAPAIFQEQLDNCRVEYFDFYLLHGIGKREDFDRKYLHSGVLDYLRSEKERGRVKRLGFSFHGDLESLEYFLSLGPWDFVQIQLNYVDWFSDAHADQMYRMLEERGIQSVIMEPLLGGRLASVNPVARQLLQTARPADTPAKWAFRFAGSLPGVLTVLSGMSNMDHLKENLNILSADMDPISDSEMSLLSSVANAINSFNLIPCTACRYCMPCPYGVEIPTIFQHYNDSVNQGTVPDAKSQGNVEFRRKRREYLVSYDKLIGKQSQASRCIGCRKCVALCPQHINIPQQMRRLDGFVDSLRFYKEK